MLRTLDRVIGGGVTLLGLLLLAMVGLSFCNIVGRYVFNSALLWADEVGVFALIVMTWLGGVACAWRGLDIRMSILADLLPSRWQRPLAVVQQLAIAGLCGWVTWLSWGYVARIARVGMTSDSAGLPMWTVHSAMTVSLGLIALVALIRLADLLTGGSGHLTRRRGAGQ